MNVTLEGQTALVTGAGSGIGAAIAKLFHEVGATVVAADLDLSAASRTAVDCAGMRPVQLDVRDEQSVMSVVGTTHSQTGRLDVLVNVAGIGSTTSTPATTLDRWEDVFAVNARGTFLCCKHALVHMLDQRAGAIVNIASVAGLVGLRNRAAYCSSKGAVIALTRAIAVDHVGDGVRANCICPGTVDSPWVRRLVEESGESLDKLCARQPMGRLGTPDEIAHAALYLSCDTSHFCTGSSLVIDGGLTAA